MLIWYPKDFMLIFGVCFLVNGLVMFHSTFKLWLNEKYG